MPIDTSGLKECIHCGRCCFSADPKYLYLAHYDYERLGKKATKVTRWIDGSPYMRMSSDGHCAQLTFDTNTKQYLCSIYEQRPDVCRVLERGV